MLRVKDFKNGAYTSIERVSHNGMYIVKVYGVTGNLIDKVVCDDYHNALDYFRSFKAIAKNA